jgi:hypothetical protein
VDGQRHPHRDRLGPEPVVLRGRVRLAAREDAEVHAPQPELRAVVELGDGVVEAGPRDDAQTDETIA